MSDIIALIEECQKTLNSLIDMAHKDKQKQVKYLAASRENATTKSYNLMNAIVGGRIMMMNHQTLNDHSHNHN